MNIDEILTRGVAEIINKDSLKQKLEAGKSLRIKYGVDPTKPDIHLGHTVALWKLKAMQNMGHTIIFLIGDYTTKIGDPSGRNTTRPNLSDEEIKANAKTYFEQIGKILDIKKTEIRYNSEWFEKMTWADALALTSKFSTSQIIERDDFAKRLGEGSNLGLQELLYPVMQAYDSVELKADVEFGGSDQKFNMLAGRELQKKIGQTPQEVVMTKILIGLDGKNKMSKSLNNYIAITDAPTDMYGKVMSIPDELIPDYFELCTDQEMPVAENPRDQKMKLAFEIVKLYHNDGQAQVAQDEFVKVFSNRELPSEILELKHEIKDIKIDDFLYEGIAATKSKSEAQRLIQQGAVSINNKIINDPMEIISVNPGMIIKIGKRRFYKIK